MAPCSVAVCRHGANEPVGETAYSLAAGAFFITARASRAIAESAAPGAQHVRYRRGQGMPSASARAAARRHTTHQA